MIREVIEWHTVAERMPDDDETVLIEIEEPEGEPVWLGWCEGGEWFDASGAPIRVIKWARMPTGEATA